MTFTLLDTHAHLNSDAFDDNLEQVLQSARSAGVVAINVIGIDADSSLRACQLAAEYPGFLFATIGIQPNSAAHALDDDWQRIVALVDSPGVCAIGETGLDCYWDDTPIEMQKAYFDQHMQLCRDRGLPMVIHMRDSGELIVEQLKQQTSVPPGVMHSFTGDEPLARQCLDFGLHISFAGMVTYKKSDPLRRVAAMVPDDRLLIETDSPYLSPEPFRGKRPNEPSRVEHTLRCLAQVRGVTPEYLASVTTENAKRLFSI